MRGRIDLGDHKLADVFWAPLRKTGRTSIRKPRGEMHRQLWRLVDGAVRDTFMTHPDYLTVLGSKRAVDALNKRIVGSLCGYATQVAQGRSARSTAGSAAVEEVNAHFRSAASTRRGVYAVSWALAVWTRAWAAFACLRRPKFKGGA